MMARNRSNQKKSGRGRRPVVRDGKVSGRVQQTLDSYLTGSNPVSPDLLGIFVVGHRDYNLSAESILAKLDLSDWKVLSYDVKGQDPDVINTKDFLAPGENAYAGFLVVVENSNRKKGQVIVLRDWYVSEKISLEGRAAALLNVLYHELGHLDDFVRGVNLRYDDEVDVQAAESYAHVYALRKCLDDATANTGPLIDDVASPAYLPSRVARATAALLVEFYLDEFLAALSKSEDEVVREAARSALKNPIVASARSTATQWRNLVQEAALHIELAHEALKIGDEPPNPWL